jgi:thiol-disulfide isomerase/thioredoxin
MRRRLRPLMLMLVLAAATTRADVVTLTTGEELRGTVTGYRNMAFELSGADGVSKTIASPRVRRIEFEKRPQPVTLETRHRGTLQAVVRRFEDGAFVLETGQKIPAVFVSGARFAEEAVKKIDHIPRGSSLEMSKHLVPGKVTVVDFYADWCLPCRMISPHLEKLARETPEVVLRKVNVDQNSALARKFNIRGIPHINIYDPCGNLTGTVVGANVAQVEKLVKQARAVVACH